MACALKMYKMQSLAVENGKNTLVDLRLEFEGKRAFAIWDSIPLGHFEFISFQPTNLRMKI